MLQHPRHTPARVPPQRHTCRRLLPPRHPWEKVAVTVVAETLVLPAPGTALHPAQNSQRLAHRPVPVGLGTLCKARQVPCPTRHPTFVPCQVNTSARGSPICSPAVTASTAEASKPCTADMHSQMHVLWQWCAALRLVLWGRPWLGCCWPALQRGGGSCATCCLQWSTPNKPCAVTPQHRGDTRGHIAAAAAAVVTHTRAWMTAPPGPRHPAGHGNPLCTPPTPHTRRQPACCLPAATSLMQGRGGYGERLVALKAHASGP